MLNLRLTCVNNYLQFKKWYLQFEEIRQGGEYIVGRGLTAEDTGAKVYTLCAIFDNFLGLGYGEASLRAYDYANVGGAVAILFEYCL